MSGARPFRLALTVLAGLSLASCSDGPEVKRFATTKAGNAVMDGGDFCALNVDAGKKRMSVTVGKNDRDRGLSFSAPEVRIAGGQTSADYALLFMGIDGKPTDYAPERVRYLRQGTTEIITMVASDKAMVFLSLTNDVAFVFNGTIIGRYKQKSSYREDLEVLARCAGMPLARLLGIEGK